MICVSDLLQYQAERYIYDADGTRIGCQDQIKALGMVFETRPTMAPQVERIRRAVRQRYWTLRNLKKNGFTSEELVQVNKTMIRPVAEYGCVAYHPSLTDEQDELIERLQNHTLKCIYGSGMSARKMRGWLGSQL